LGEKQLVLSLAEVISQLAKNPLHVFHTATYYDPVLETYYTSGPSQEIDILLCHRPCTVVFHHLFAVVKTFEEVDYDGQKIIA